MRGCKLGFKKRPKRESRAEKIARRVYGVEVGDTIRLSERRIIQFPFGSIETDQLKVAKVVLIRIGQEDVGIGVYFEEAGTKSLDRCFVGDLSKVPVVKDKKAIHCNLDVLLKSDGIEIIKNKEK